MEADLSWIPKRPAPHDGRFRNVILPLSRLFAAPILFLLGPLRVRGADRVPREGGVLILCNHLSDIDPVIVQAACPRPLHYMAKRELFAMGRLGRIIVRYGAFPVKRGQADRTALRNAADLLKAGEPVVVFPEGQLSETGELQPLQPGISMILKLAPGIPVICLGLKGTPRMLPYGKLIPRPAWRRVLATWGESTTFSEGFDPEEFLGWVRAQLSELGEYSTPPT